MLAAAAGRGFKVRFGGGGDWPSLDVYEGTYLSDYAQLVDLFPDNSLAAAAAAADFCKDTETFPFLGFL